MNDLKGIHLNELPLTLDKFVGVLLFSEFPSTTIFTTASGNPIMKEWIDSDESDTINRYYIYETTLDNLHFFINGIISHLELYENSINQLGYIIDEKETTIQNISIVTPQTLPIDYLPGHDSYFREVDSVDTQEIIQFFKLDEIKIHSSVEDTLLEQFAKKHNYEIFNIHLKKGPGIGFGRIDTSLLSETLSRFNNLYVNVAQDVAYGNNRGDLVDQTQDDIFKTEIIYTRPGSYNIYIRPKVSQFSLFDRKSSSEMVSDLLYRLINETESIDILSDSFHGFSSFVFKAYINFLKYVIKKDVSIDLKWLNPSNMKKKSKSFSQYYANQSKNVIESLQGEEEFEFEETGKFHAINCDTGWYIFYNTNDEQFGGHFIKDYFDTITNLNFKDLYKITFNRKIIKTAGRIEPKIIDKIIDYNTIKE